MIIFIFLFLFVASTLQLFFSLILRNAPINSIDQTLLLVLLMPFAGFLSAIFVGWICGKYLDDVPFKALGINFSKRGSRDLFYGVVFGASSILIALLLGGAAGRLTFEFNSTSTMRAILFSLFSSFLIFTFGSFFEEAFARGYMLQTLLRARLPIIGLIFTSSIFSLGHIGNPSSSSFALANTFLGGLLLAYAYMKTRALWFPIGWHFAWNWVQGPIAGVEVSGLTSLFPAPLFRNQDLGPDWFTGGHYGVEGGILCTIALLIGILMIYFAKFLKPDPELLELTNHEPPTTNLLINHSNSNKIADSYTKTD